jgi:hypothetical protein
MSTGFAARRAQALDTGQKRHAWRLLIERVRRCYGRAVETDGRETVGELETALDLSRTSKLHWEQPGDGAAGAANTALELMTRAAQSAGTDRRRAILAAAAVAMADCVDALITETADRESAASRRACGERDED